MTRTKRRHPVIRGILLTLAFLLAGAIGFVSFALIKLQANINSIDISSALGKRPDVVATADSDTDRLPLNILLVGSDTRDLSDPDEFGGTSDITTRDHSDTTILLHIAADRKSAYGISIPRDSMVRRPNCANPEKVPVSRAPLGMFNSAYNDGGIGCTVMTVEANTGVRVDHYAVVDFEGFRDMVDALGGVDICLNEAARDTYTGLDLSAGTSHLNGHQASQFVRARHGFGDGSDIGRMERQQAFLSALVREATDSRLLLRPDRLYSFLTAATDSVTMDKQLANLSTLSDLALQLKNLPPDKIQFITIPNETYPPDPNRVQWKQPDARLVWEAARIDSPLPGQPGTRVGPQPGPTTPVTVSPEQLSVKVYNGSGAPGLARQAADVLTAQGFGVTGYDSATGTGKVDNVLIRYPQGQEETLATLQAAFPGALVESSPALSTFEVILGPAAGDVQEVPNRLSTQPLPAQPIKAPQAGQTAEPQPTAPVKPRDASDDACI